MLNSKKKPDSGNDKVRGQTGAGPGARTEPRLTVYASAPGGESGLGPGSRTESELPHAPGAQAPARRGPVMSPGARSLAAVGPVQKKKEAASDEAEEVAGRVAPTFLRRPCIAGLESRPSTAVYTALAPNRFKDFWRD